MLRLRRFAEKYFFIVINFVTIVGIGLITALFTEGLAYKAGQRLPNREQWFLILLLLANAVNSAVKEIQQDTLPNSHVATFMKLYSKSLTSAIKSVRGLLSNSSPQPEEAMLTLKALLSVICSIVESYYRPSHTEDDFGINANIMLPIEVAGKIATDFPRLHFLDPARKGSLDHYTCILEICVWSDEREICVPDKFSLPVETGMGAGRVILGAPRAYHRGKVEVLSDTKQSKVLKEMLKDHVGWLRDELEAYFTFNGRKFRGFISIPLRSGDKVVGILNIQTNVGGMFKSPAAYEKGSKSTLSPFARHWLQLYKARSFPKVRVFE